MCVQGITPRMTSGWIEHLLLERLIIQGMEAYPAEVNEERLNRLLNRLRHPVLGGRESPIVELNPLTIKRH
jgi:hypothetical protein